MTKTISDSESDMFNTAWKTCKRTEIDTVR